MKAKADIVRGNTDTEYKREVARLFEEVGKQVSWQQLGEGFDAHCFRFQVLDQGDSADWDWRDSIEKLLQEALAG